MMVIEQWAPLRLEKCAYSDDHPHGLLCDEAFQPFMGDSARTEQTHNIY
jgi:hypothetical protein